MKRLLLISALVLIAASVFAQNAAAPAAAPAQNYEFYGSAWFDYHLTGTGTSMDTPLLSDFTFSKLRFGFNAKIADTVNTKLELDPRNLEIRHAYVNWMPIDNLSILAGRTFTYFQQIAQYYGGGREDMLQIQYSVPGIGWAGVEISNNSDLAFVSGNWLLYPPPKFAPNFSKGTSAVTTGIAQDPWLHVIPAIVFKPNLGDFNLEVGAQAYVIPQLLGGNGYNTTAATVATTTAGASASGYFTVGAYGVTFTNEFTYFNLNASANSAQEWTYYAQLTYNAGFVAPTVYFLTDTTDLNANQPNTAIGFELPFVVAKGFKINPFFNYAITNYNAFEANWAIKTQSYNKNDWVLGLRFDYSFSEKF